jgi:hypothetical protein
MRRSREHPQTLPASWAEWLLDVGKRAHKLIRSGAGIEEVSRKLQTTSDTCQLSLVFVAASDLVKLRAMFENWTRERLILELGGIYRAAAEKEEAPQATP